VHTPAQVTALFADLELHGFSAEDDAGTFIEHADLHRLSDANYACGMFWFRKPA
jgi:hypothetical protein